jgi:hypothetical protein
MFNIDEIPEEEHQQYFQELEEDIKVECGKLGEIVKITVSAFIKS